MKTLTALSILSFSVLMTSRCFAQTVTLNPVQDATIYEPDAAATQLSGGAGGLFAGRTGSERNRRAALKFDVAGSVPAGAVIQSATLAIRVAQSNSGVQSFDLRVLSESWGEGTVLPAGGGGAGSDAEAGDATWRYRFYPDVEWTALGGSFGAQIAGSTVGNAGSLTFSGEGLITAVQSMLDAAESNHGFYILGPESGGATAKRFHSREATDIALRPTLTITYEVPPPGCTADWNQDGGVDGDDIISYFADWDANQADYDGSGGTDGDDVIAFFADWDAGC